MPLIRKPSEPAPPKPVETAEQAVAALASSASDERWAAARRLATAPEAVEALGRALATEQDARVREAIFTSLARIGTPTSAAVVLDRLRSDDASARTGALDALHAMPDAAAAHLPLLLQDADPDVRLLATELARELPAAEATRLLCDVIETEALPNVCAAAVEVLAEVGGPAALPALQRCAARFPAEAFLGFSIKIAAERIGSAPPHG